MTDPSTFSLMVHGGAGTLDNLTAEREAAFLGAMRRVLAEGRHALEAGGSALDTVEMCCALLEDDPLFNAGRGSVLNADGRVEMDAAIMDGRDLKAGAVAGVMQIANPVKLARQVMTQTSHVLLIGNGALRFAEKQGISLMPDDYFLTDERHRQLTEAQATGSALLDHDTPEQTKTGDDKMGTVGCVARDIHGHLAAATSTGGITNKSFGRVGDSPVIGAGLYADDLSCAVSATGYGEDFLRTALAKRLADTIELLNLNASAATLAAMDTLARRVNGRGGVICIDKSGHCAAGHTTKRLIHGWIEKGGVDHVSL